MTIDLNEYSYRLPEERIAQYPVSQRDMSQLLIFKEGGISKDLFMKIDEYLPSDSLLVFNNTRVIRARLLFRKETGALIEILCLEPVDPADYESSFSSKEPVEWKCIIGNLKKWKSGKLVSLFNHEGNLYDLSAERVQPDGEAWRIKFAWNSQEISFGEVIEAAGHIPLPPYIGREDEETDNIRYQTIFSRIKGSVAAPTAGLHFTESVFKKLEEKGIKSLEITLHVGAGTFKPVKSENIYDHEMHCEHFYVTRRAIETISENQGKIIPVGTTSLRTLESLYWLGVKTVGLHDQDISGLSLGQWEMNILDKNISVKESMGALLKLLNERNLPYLHASTNIMITPGYRFRMIDGMVTNFHQPGSTLLLLVSAWTGDKWHDIYNFALENDFRFLSYGDCSLLLR